jgi:hypothetical protein
MRNGKLASDQAIEIAEPATVEKVGANRARAFYATQDAADGKIFRDATIRKFATEAEARAYLLQGYDPKEWDLSTAEIGPGDYRDCWMEWMKAPRVGNPGAGDGYAPFTFNQLFIQHPGQHPGGRFWWITPAVDVLIITEIHEIEVA